MCLHCWVLRFLATFSESEHSVVFPPTSALKSLKSTTATFNLDRKCEHYHHHHHHKVLLNKRENVQKLSSVDLLWKTKDLLRFPILHLHSFIFVEQWRQKDVDKNRIFTCSFVVTIIIISTIKQLHNNVLSVFLLLTRSILENSHVRIRKNCFCFH